MSNSFKSYQPSAFVVRQNNQAVARIGTNSYVRHSQMEAEADLGGAAVICVGQVATTALQSAALLSLLEQTLVQTVPASSARMAAIADVAAIAMTDLVIETAQKLRRV